MSMTDIELRGYVKVLEMRAQEAIKKGTNLGGVLHLTNESCDLLTESEARWFAAILEKVENTIKDSDEFIKHLKDGKRYFITEPDDDDDDGEAAAALEKAAARIKKLEDDIQDATEDAEAADESEVETYNLAVDAAEKSRELIEAITTADGHKDLKKPKAAAEKAIESLQKNLAANSGS